MVINQNVPVNERQKIIFSHINNGESYTVQQFAEKLDVTEKTIKRDLQLLKELNLIKRIGSDKNGKWAIWNEKSEETKDGE